MPCPYGAQGQTPGQQYPCPGACGCFVTDGNVPCLRCWLWQNPLRPADLRGLPRAHRPPLTHPRMRLFSAEQKEPTS